MSGPVSSTEDAPTVAASTHAEPPCLEVSESREAAVGQMRVRRALPRRRRRTVGAWCFADHMGPSDVDETGGLDIGPHPHIGLQTVTWLVQGTVLHRDSLGTEQLITPGQLNLMTAGDGVSHAEEDPGGTSGTLHGVQLWVAQPDETRRGAPAFEHHDALPQAELRGADATVLVGAFGDAVSPARHDTPLLGIDLALHGGVCTAPLDPAFEHALVVLDGELAVDDRPVTPGRLAYLGQGRDELVLDAAEPTRALLLGGEPMEEGLVMWWNFVGRSRDEIDDAFASWERQDDRFGRVASDLPRMPVDPPTWQRRPRRED